MVINLCYYGSKGVEQFSITDTKLYVPVVTLSKQNNAKFLPQLKSGFKRTINWNKYQSNPKSICTKQIFKLFS